MVALDGDDVMFRTKGSTREVVPLVVQGGTPAAELLDALDQAVSGNSA